MKRHEKLIPISRDHHQMLILARLMRDDAPPYKGLPTDPEEKAAYAKHQFEEFLLPHFAKKEKVMDWVIDQEEESIAILSEELKAEQKALTRCFELLTINSLDKTGRDLENHIRRIERELFEQMQDSFDLDSLEF